MEDTNNSSSSITMNKDAILIAMGSRRLRVSMSPRSSNRASLGRRSSRASLLRRLRTYAYRRRSSRASLRRRLRTYAYHRRSSRFSLRRRLRTYAYRRQRLRTYAYRRWSRYSSRLSLRQRLRAYAMASRSSQALYNPLPGRIVTGGYGYRRYPRRGMHHGIDITAPTGTPIRPSSSGVVSYAGYNGGYGKTVVIRHSSGLSTKYAHLSRILVGRGTYVGRGTTIGKVGSTGFSTGPHLHFEVRINNSPVNPSPFVNGL
jgi:murein DD-endopeptidase MepM/ murein hydrolase activator NlpD